jgi:ribosomal-protein-alanine N-acetyltransferase
LTTQAEIPGPGSPDAGTFKYLIEPMQVRHIPAVSAIERDSFLTSWSGSAYRREIERNQMAYYVVAKRSALAGPPLRERRFPITGVDSTDESDGLFARLARLLRGDARSFAPEEAAELEAIVGYSGMWLMVDQAHITTIAVDPPYRSQGVGELLLVTLLDRACEVGASEATLECRVSNHIAQALYRKYTFREAGIRKRYYSDDGEDAVIMTSEALTSRTFEEVLARNRRMLLERLRVKHD